MLLKKDPNQRPTVREILKMPLIRQKALEFQNQPQATRSNTVVYKKNVPKVVKPSLDEEEKHLTPA